MKKIGLLVMLIGVCLCLAACSSSSSKELTTENIGEYLSIKANVIDSNVTTKNSTVAGIGIKSYSGSSTVGLQIVNQSSAKFENVEITLEVSTDLDTMNVPAWFGWEFNTGNQQTGKASRMDKNYKIIKVALPYDGNWSSTENLSLALYAGSGEYLFTPRELSYCNVKVTNVKGIVKK